MVSFVSWNKKKNWYDDDDDNECDDDDTDEIIEPKINPLRPAHFMRDKQNAKSFKALNFKW